MQQIHEVKVIELAEPHFSENSYGFRPGRRAQQAVIKLLEYLNDGYEYIVDIDLEKFFDNVPQDKLMTLVGKLIHDPDTESLISKYLKAGVMVRGQYEKTEKGTPQGGNLSPLLSNIMLNELDKELEARKLRFVRYADDCVITVGSSAAANRVMHTITDWIERKLGLKVNMTKTKVTRPSGLKYLGFGFWKDGKDGKWKARPYQDSVSKFKRKLKELTKRSWSVPMDLRIQKLNEVIRGWINYFKIGSMKTKLEEIDERLRTRMRIVIWKQWKTSKNTAYFALCPQKDYENGSGNTVYLLDDGIPRPPKMCLCIRMQVQLPKRKLRKTIQMLCRDLPDAVDMFIAQFDINKISMRCSLPKNRLPSAVG